MASSGHMAPADFAAAQTAAIWTLPDGWSPAFEGSEVGGTIREGREPNAPPITGKKDAVWVV